MLRRDTGYKTWYNDIREQVTKIIAIITISDSIPWSRMLRNRWPRTGSQIPTTPTRGIPVDGNIDNSSAGQGPLEVSNVPSTGIVTLKP